MGQQSSRQPISIYFHKTLPSFLFRKSHRKTSKPEEPIKFLYKSKKSTEKHKDKAKNNEKFGFHTFNNLKNVIDSVKNVNEVKGGNNIITKSRKTSKEAKKTVKKANKVKKSENFNVNNPKLKRTSTDIKKDVLNKKEAWNVTAAFKYCPKGGTETNFIENNLNKTKKDPKKQNVPIRTKSEPNLRGGRGRERHRHKRKGDKLKGDNAGRMQQFGYEIQDVDGFLAKATLDKPANIPVVLAFPSVLYRTRAGGYQAEISLPLGMVVNAIFKNQNWLYVQTPHAEEGYVSYSACLPLGIIPPSDEDNNLSPCWEKSTDVFPKPSGNMTDTEKLSCKSECGNEEDTYCSRSRFRSAFSTCGEKSVDRLYLRAAAIAKGKGTRHTLLVINDVYNGSGKGAISVSKNEVVFLLSTKIKGWFYVRNKEGLEGFIPSAIAGHGFL